VESVLHELLDGRGFSWVEVGENTIAVKKKPDPELERRVEGDSVSTITVTGKVVNEKGEPIVGATVLVKDTQLGTTTSSDGSFRLPGVKRTGTIVITNIAYLTKAVLIKERSNIGTIQLGEYVDILDEAQIVAYGTTTKRYSTSNINTIKAEDIERQPISNPLLALQGRVPGLLITPENGIPGGGIKVRIQGQNSIGSGNDPLYVIDGVPYVSQMLNTTSNNILGGSGGSGGSGNPLSYINPSDIESIDILKDADATAIYGSRAANGAILITTKRGKVGETKVDFNVQHGWGRVSHMVRLMNTQQYQEMRYEALKSDGISTPSSIDYDINGLWDKNRYTDWQKTLIGGTAHYSNIYASISGGTATAKYLIGGTYRRETTVFSNDFSDRKGGAHFNLNTASSNQKFKTQLSGNYLVDNNLLPSFNLTNTALQLAPNAPALYTADGNLNWQLNSFGASSWSNPLSAFLEKYQNRTTNLIGNLILSYSILPELEIKSSFGYNNLLTKEFMGSPLVAIRPEFRSFTPRTATFSNSTISSWIIEPQATYKREIGKGGLDVLIGATIQQRKNDGENLLASGYNSDAALADIHSATSVTVNSTIVSLYKYNALFGRLNYNWKDKYILNFTGRRDGSSRFGSKNQFHNFGSIGAAWIFSEEYFMKNAISFLSFGKLRGSYGTTGNDQIPDYQFLNLYSPINLGVPYQGGTALLETRLTNPYLQWEETKKLQFGIDLGFLKNRIVFTGNYVRNRSSNQLLDYNLPSITGFTTISSNFPATIQNTALELSLNTVNVKSKTISWTSNFNITVPKNKLVSFPNLANSSYADFLIVNYSLGVSKALHSLGVDPGTGAYQFADSKGNPTQNPDYATDRVVIIDNGFPKFYGGLGNNFTYKGFQLDIFFQFIKQYRSGGYQFGNSLSFYQPGRRNTNQPTSVLNRWQKPGDVTDIQRYSSNTSAFSQYRNLISSDAYYEDASFIRLKNLSVSYQLSEKWRRKLHMNDCKIYVQAQNLFTITKYTGVDPESPGSAPIRYITLGVQATL